ncbi:MAG: DUF1631 family protein [Gammaproteobacteria bacterium]
MAETKQLILDIRDAMSAELCLLVREALQDAAVAMRNQTSTSLDGQKLFDAKQSVEQRFKELLEANFDSLVIDKSEQKRSVDYSSLSLVQEGDLEAMIAMEGMIAHARNCDIQQYLCFNTRLDAIFFGTRIDESNSPMDPEQIGDAFKDALVSLGLQPNGLLMVYRQFNSKVFHQLEEVLQKANEILIANDVLPDLDIAARQKEAIKGKRGQPRAKVDPTERAFSGEDAWSGGSNEVGSKQLFSVMQSLLHRMGNAGPGDSGTAPASQAGGPGESAPQGLSLGAAPLKPGMLVGGRKVELMATDRLVNLLEKLDQSSLEEDGGPADISKSIGSELEALSDGDVIQAVDGPSTDVINLINLLYEAIWEDVSVPIPVKDLIGRTQITALKLALQEPEFFDSDSHPMRVLINELATAGISWTESAEIADDPVYQQMKKTVASLVNEYEGSSAYIEKLIEEFSYFKRRQLLTSLEPEHKLLDADEREERLEEVKQYAREKIRERILDPATPDFARNFLENLFHKFLVKVILREGPGGVSWKPIMNTIDVLLWTVSPERNADDLKRFLKLKTRLLINLSKALDVAEVPKDEAMEALRKLQKVQENSFKPEEAEDDAGEAGDFSEWMAKAKPVTESKLPPLPESDEHLQRVNNLPIGIWMEFQTEGDKSVRCTLAARIDTIDKYVFVNSQGVKVIEKSRMGLARELKAGTVKVISEAPLIERAMETVIGKLRAA